ncbi:hypothetical protein [Anaerosolibacter sp.]|uniref:hypothetical protein n=1 Tax=Anaerosolibacter sp. TaxID=1872527 RepID=UPI0039EDED3B
MKLEHYEPEYASYFVRMFLEPVIKTHGVNIDKAFPNLRIWLGAKPPFEANADKNNLWHENYRRPHFTENDGLFYCVIPDLFKGILPPTERIYTLCHEIGHYVHTVYLKDDMEKWAKWAAETGHRLDTEFKNDGGYPRITSHEDFAIDFSKIALGQCKNINYYMKLLKNGIA